MESNHYYAMGSGGMEGMTMGMGMGMDELPPLTAGMGMGFYGLYGDKPSATQKPVIIPSSPRGSMLREELLSKIVPWKEIAVSFEDFPYYIDEETKSHLVECLLPILKRNELRKYCARLDSSSQRILLQSIPGTELYRERVVSALAREMEVPLLMFDLGEDHGRRLRYRDVYPRLVFKAYHGRDLKFKKGDRVQYVGGDISIEEADNRTLSHCQRGDVYEDGDGGRVAVVFNISGLKQKEEEKDEKNTEIQRQAVVVWLDVRDVIQDSDIQLHDSEIALEVLYKVLESQQPMIVYFAENFFWQLSKGNASCPALRNIFNQLPEGVVMIYPENDWPDEFENEHERFLRRQKSVLHELFSNVVCIKPPKDEDLVTLVSETNLQTMRKVLKDNNLSCMDLEHPIIDDMILKRKKVEKIVGWAVNHHLTSCPIPCVNKEKLHIPHESVKLAISRFMEGKYYRSRSKNKSKSIQDKEEWIVSAVVHSEDIGIKFDDIGVLENVKKVLYETVILPLRRPELFSHGNTLRFCKGILLFGPPGTGKTLVAKALATESKANFINITAAAFTSMSFEALFSCASKLAPVIIYLDEVDTFLGACGPDKNGSNKLNEFMAAWDRWNLRESQRILLIGATNRPFDLDEAVIRRMPRRIYVGLPDLDNRSKILKSILDKENLEPGFSFHQLADATEGYSGSDLKNLRDAAVYGPIKEFLEQESKGEAPEGSVPALRPLNLNDFIRAKSKVRPSVAENASSIIKLREWKEQYGEEGEEGQ